jgi:hypothetical protein
MSLSQWSKDVGSKVCSDQPLSQQSIYSFLYQQLADGMADVALVHEPTNLGCKVKLSL